MRFQDGVGETACLSQKEECNRMYTPHYDSPLGGILLAADEVGLTGLWFEGEKYFANILGPEQQERETPALQTAKRWLDVYFGGQEPDGGMEGTDGVGGVLVLGFSICRDASFWGRVRMATMRPCHPMRRWSGRSLPLISAVRAAIIGNMG